MASLPIDWLLESPEPWTRYRTRIDLLLEDKNDKKVIQDRKEMISHPLVQGLITRLKNWPGYPLKRHNDAKHPIHGLAVLADFGLGTDDSGMKGIINKVKFNQSPEGAFLTQIRLYKRFGGLDGEYWTWMACDAPVLLYSLLAFGLNEDPAVKLAKLHLISQRTEIGWRCSASDMLGSFKGPGKREHPCPIANVYALKALAQDPELTEDPDIVSGVEMLLDHWEYRGEQKYFLFGIGTDYQKLKYPLVWYDILHVLDVLSRFPFARTDPRYHQMVEVVRKMGDEKNRFVATSMYRAWKDWSFANKKEPSPWLTFLVHRVLLRSGIPA
jgi:hypothetical protein